MARIPMVTRTIKSTTCTCRCVDTLTEEIVKFPVVLPRTYKDNKEIAKIIEKQNLLPSNFKLVDIVETTVSEQIYGMSEVEFLASAKPIER